MQSKQLIFLNLILIFNRWGFGVLGPRGDPGRAGAGLDADLHRHGGGAVLPAGRTVPGTGGADERTAPPRAAPHCRSGDAGDPCSPCWRLRPGWGALGVKGYVLSFATRMMIFAIAAVSLDFILGFGGLWRSFGDAAYLGIGAYAAGIMVAEGQEDAFLGLPWRLVVAAGFAAATGAIAMRTKGVAFIMITLAFGQMAYFVANALSEDGGSDGLTLWTRSTVFGQKLRKAETVFDYVVLGCLVACTALVLALTAVRGSGGRCGPAARTRPGWRDWADDVDRIGLAAYVVSAMSKMN